MVLINFLAFVVFKILQIIADISKIRKTVLLDLKFIFNVLLGSATGFI